MCDCEIPEFMSERILTARKRHKCHECRQTIKPGEKYKATAGKASGEFYYSKTCMECVQVGSLMRQIIPDFCGAGLEEELHNYGILWWDLEEDQLVLESPYLQLDGETVRLQPWAKELLAVMDARFSLQHKDKRDDWWKDYRGKMVDKAIASLSTF